MCPEVLERTVIQGQRRLVLRVGGLCEVQAVMLVGLWTLLQGFRIQPGIIRATPPRRGRLFIFTAGAAGSRFSGRQTQWQGGACAIV